MPSYLHIAVLGDRHVKLSRNSAAYWSAVDMVRRDLTRTPRTAPVPGLGHLNQYDLSRLGFPIRLETHLLGVLNTFVLHQYDLHRSCTIEVEPGDVVIDGGACWGDTALYFAERCGPDGTVLLYEFAPENLQVMARNVAANQDLAARVRIVERALWHASGERLNCEGSGPGSHVGVNGGERRGAHVLTDAIDDRVALESLRSVDFIKMDIEGAELDALRGAEQTLRRFAPKLAISVYHRLEHFWQIPEYLHGLSVGYRFYLDHFTIHSEETVLFAVADEL